MTFEYVGILFCYLYGSLPRWEHDSCSFQNLRDLASSTLHCLLQVVLMGPLGPIVAVSLYRDMYAELVTLGQREVLL